MISLKVFLSYREPEEVLSWHLSKEPFWHYYSEERSHNLYPFTVVGRCMCACGSRSRETVLDKRLCSRFLASSLFFTNFFFSLSLQEKPLLIMSEFIFRSTFPSLSSPANSRISRPRYSPVLSGVLNWQSWPQESGPAEQAWRMWTIHSSGHCRQLLWATNHVVRTYNPSSSVCRLWLARTGYK